MRPGLRTGKLLVLLVAFAGWTDLVRPHFAAACSGRIERVSTFCTGESGTNDENLTAADQADQEPADPIESVSDQLITEGCAAIAGSAVVVSHQPSGSISSDADRRPSERGPPPALP